MKRQLTAFCLFALAVGTLQLPAQAGLDVSFGRYDHDRDGRWNYGEFNNANRYYGHRMSDRELRHDYRRLDRNRDGYLSPSEVRAYNW